MKSTFQCPKCQSTNVLEVTGYRTNTNNIIPLSKWSLHSAVLDRYICADCGYTEEYVQLSNSFKRWAAKQLSKEDRRLDDFV
ncbi:MAG: hypothetical protein AAFP19_21020 [Bacteroidota bacterium]